MMPPLHVIAVISNPIRYASRYKLYHEFAERVNNTQGAILYTVEAAYGDRPFHITDSDPSRTFRFRTNAELWHKENLIRLAQERLPDSAEYVAWVDADVTFSRNDWAEETVHQLQHYGVVQMFSHAIDMGPQYQPVGTHIGVAYTYVSGGQWRRKTATGSPYPGSPHPGYAWAARRDVLDDLGGLMQNAIAGAGDSHMAWAMLGAVRDTDPGISPEYTKMLVNYEDQCTRYLKQNVGYVPMTLTHYWHGKKRDRGYVDRWKILRDEKYDPFTDVVTDTHGLLRLAGNKLGLRDKLMSYFRSRNEDSVDLT